MAARISDCGFRIADPAIRILQFLLPGDDLPRWWTSGGRLLIHFQKNLSAHPETRTRAARVCWANEPPSYQGGGEGEVEHRGLPNLP